MTDQQSPSPAPARVLHLADRAAWSAARTTGAYEGSTRGHSLAEVGFVHMSTAAQLPGVVSFLYSGVPADDVVLLVVDLTELASRGVGVRWENLDGGADPYPHAYGPLPLPAVVAALDLEEHDGVLRLPDLTGWGVLEHPPAG